jgi:predicted N-acetyltransferase YhbS
MSLAMWTLYGGGLEAVAIKTTREKLEITLNDNETFPSLKIARLAVHKNHQKAGIGK